MFSKSGRCQRGGGIWWGWWAGASAEERMKLKELSWCILCPLGQALVFLTQSWSVLCSLSLCTCLYVRARVYVCVRTCTYMCVRVYTCVRAYMRTCIRVYVCI
jgi:hypothetical protein